MEQEHLAPVVGLLACALAAVLVAVPYVLVPASEQVVVGFYYGLGVVSPVAVGVLGLIGVVAFASGWKERSDPGLVAGVMLAAGAFSLLASLQWALSFGGLRTDVAGAATLDLLAIHRWAVVLATVLWTAAAGWYTRALGLG